eukprot:scaffold10645_cov46-Attheya_sp.AAC.1
MNGYYSAESSCVFDFHNVGGTGDGGGSVDNDYGVACFGSAVLEEGGNGFGHDGFRVFNAAEESGGTSLEDSKGLACGGGRGGQDRNGHAGTELGNLPGRGTTFGTHNNGLGPHINGRLDGRRRNRLGRTQMTIPDQGRISDGLIEGIVIDRHFRLPARARHNGDGRLGIVSIGRLSTQHDTVRHPRPHWPRPNIRHGWDEDW